MISKIVSTADEAVVDISDGSTIMIGGFGGAGQPLELIEALIRKGTSSLVVINNNAGNGDLGLAKLIQLRRVQKMICSFPRQTDSQHFDEEYLAGRIELELIPQGNLAERIRAAGFGIGAFYSRTGVGTALAEGRELREIDGKTYALEFPIFADFAFIGAFRGDRYGNLTYRKTSRNFGPIMATAARVSIAQVDRIVAPEELDPETIVTPGIFTNRIIEVGDRDWVKDQQHPAVNVGGMR